MNISKQEPETKKARNSLIAKRFVKKHEDVIVTLISFYLFNGNLLLICHSCCSKSGRFGKMETFTVRRVTRYLIKAWGARGGTHSYDYGDNPGTYFTANS